MKWLKRDHCISFVLRKGEECASLLVAEVKEKVKEVCYVDLGEVEKFSDK